MRKKSYFVIILSLLSIFALSLAFTGCGQAENSEEEPEINGENDITEGTERPDEGVMVGSEAPLFTLENLDGEEASLEDYRGDILVISFWETWCPGCQQQNPNIDELFKEYSDTNVSFLTINSMQRDDIESIEQYIDENNYSFPVLIDEESSTAYDYRVLWLPSNYIIDAEGIIRYEKFGPASREEIEEEINDLMSSNI